MALLAEHKLDTNQPRVTAKLYEAACKKYGLGSFPINATSTPIEAPTIRKPGGVLSIVHGGLKGCLLKTGTDELGWWAYTTFCRRAVLHESSTGFYVRCYKREHKHVLSS